MIASARSRKLRLLWILAAIAVVGLVLIYARMEYLGSIYFSDALGCETKVHSELLSPSGDFKAIVFEKECGATTNFNTQVSLLPLNEKFDSEQYPPVLIVDGRIRLPIVWIDAYRLKISVPPDTTVYRKDRQYKGIQIDYE